MNLLAIQTALKALGIDPGPLDGRWGRLTYAGVKEFQRKFKLPMTIGMPGKSVFDAILAKAPPSPKKSVGLVWMDEAQSLMGTKEVGGSGSNDAILDWAKDLNIDYQSDDIPWCGLFVAHCIGVTLPEEALPDNPLGARNWRKFGNPSAPVLGSVLVFWRESKASFRGHVGFYAGERSDAYQVLGGNQSNKVGLAWIGKERLLEARWPKTAPSHGFGPNVIDSGEALSDNEQ